MGGRGAGDREALKALKVGFDTSARLPFAAWVDGIAVEVTAVLFEDDERRALVAVCRRDGEERRVPLVDVKVRLSTVETSRLLDAYRTWCSAASSRRTRSGLTSPWRYRPLSTAKAREYPPLALVDHGQWDPAEQYWPEADEQLHPIVTQILAAGPRSAFEMEQVIPGVRPEDWDLDPVADAAELHRAGADRQATRILEGLLAEDHRCIDAWVHLANIAFRAKGPKAAFVLYDRAVAIGEQSIPEGFTGLLPWKLVDNRPFLRALYGLGLCAWRQRRSQDAEQVFVSRIWLEGAGTCDAMICLNNIRARERWRSD